MIGRHPRPHRCGRVPAGIVLAILFAVLVITGPRTAVAKYAAIVVDAATGEVLHAENADAARYPASLTKMMTLYLAFEAIEAKRIGLGTAITVSRKAAGQPPTKLGLKAGTKIRVEDAILALVTKSANDAAMVLAEGLAGNEATFGTRMTAKARALGMRHTVFRNPHGLPDAKQVTTARDMAVLAHAVIYDFPQYYSYFSRASFTYRGVVHRSHNHLMGRFKGMDGLKTGYIRASGFNLASSAVRDGRRLIGVVMGGSTAGWRDDRMESLLDTAFRGNGRGGTGEILIVRRQSRGSIQLAKLPPLPTRKPLVMVTAEVVAVPAPLPPERREKVIIPDEKVTVASVLPIDVSGLDRLAASIAGAPAASTVASTAVALAPLGDWGIQVGAFADEAASRQAIDQAMAAAPELLGSTAPRLSSVETGQGRLFRARLLGLGEADARTACVHLEQTGISCLPVNPGDET